MFDTRKIRKDFPIFKRLINGKPIVYLDSTASSLKPKQVLAALMDYYQNYSVNIFRGIYKLSEEATAKYEQAREKVALFIGCKNPKEIVFVRNATEAINLVAYSWGRVNINKKSEIVSTVMEHHANIVPWQQLALETEATIKYIDFDENGMLDIDGLKNAVTEKTKLLAITYVSNVLGTINPISEITKIVKKINPQIKILVDAAQAVSHMPVNVEELNCDFLAFSGHKMLGPTGVGVLWGKYNLLEEMIPYQTGGEMIEEVRLEKSRFKDPPYKFEAGTPHVAGAIGLAAACDYLSNLGMDKVREHDRELTEYALNNLSHLGLPAQAGNLRIYGPKKAEEKGGVIAFNLKGIHAHDAAQVLDRDNVYIRSGHHCAMPLHKKLNISASCRASFYVYSTKEDVDKLLDGLKKVKKIFNH